ncbi:MAG: recombinase family protein [Lachnospiraceae bacterium]|nr:recombinase family protein [Lachnospiraceae bacterium]
MGRVYAYSRVAPGESETEIRAAMEEMQVACEDVYVDQPLQKQRKFPQYLKVLKKLVPGDLLYIRGLSDLGDGYGEVKEQWRILTKEKKVDVIVLEIPQLDTRKGKVQYGPLVADVVYSLLEYFTDSDSNVRKSRQREGIAEAKKKGIKFGRPPKQMPENFYQIYNQWVSKEITATEAAKLCNVSRTMFYQKVKEVQAGLEKFKK